MPPQSLTAEEALQSKIREADRFNARAESEWCLTLGDLRGLSDLIARQAEEIDLLLSGRDARLRDPAEVERATKAVVSRYR
jgi:hypothetical protein